MKTKIRSQTAKKSSVKTTEKSREKNPSKVDNERLLKRAAMLVEALGEQQQWLVAVFTVRDNMVHLNRVSGKFPHEEFSTAVATLSANLQDEVNKHVQEALRARQP
jgi:hypothetical protein